MLVRHCRVLVGVSTSPSSHRLAGAFSCCMRPAALQSALCLPGAGPYYFVPLRTRLSKAVAEKMIYIKANLAPHSKDEKRRFILHYRVSIQ